MALIEHRLSGILRRPIDELAPTIHEAGRELRARRSALRAAESALAVAASLRTPEQARMQAALETVRAALTGEATR